MMEDKKESLNKMIQEDYLAHQERLRVWMEAAENLAEEEHRKTVFDLLFWAKVEFHRRRTYLGLEEPELERRAALLIRRLAERL